MEYELDRPLAPLTLLERWHLFIQQPFVRLSGLIGMICLVVGYASARYFDTSDPSSLSITTVATTIPTTTQPPLAVYITGAIVKPGLVDVSPSDRIADVIDKAGGVAPGANLATCNLAQKVTDGMMITIPQGSEQGGCGSTSTSGLSTSPTGNAGLISLNSATQSELEELPGVGPSLAGAIMSYREKAPFTSINDLRKVKGIGDKRFNDLKDLVSL